VLLLENTWARRIRDPLANAQTEAMTVAQAGRSDRGFDGRGPGTDHNVTATSQQQSTRRRST
jgi:hypothetical protein